MEKATVIQASFEYIFKDSYQLVAQLNPIVKELLDRPSDVVNRCGSPTPHLTEPE